MTATAKRTGLGKGLSALLPTASSGPTTQPPTAGAADLHPREIPLASLRRNPYQPRERFSADHLDDLVASVREHGVLTGEVLGAANTELDEALVRKVEDGGIGAITQLQVGERMYGTMKLHQLPDATAAPL